MSRRTARAEYRKVHWGEAGTDGVRVLEMASAGEETFVVLGELVSVTYRTSKGHEGTVDWEHEFGENGTLPVLVFGERSKRLGVAGGAYTVTRRGIEG